MTDLSLAVRELLELGPPRLFSEAVLEVLGRHSLLPLDEAPIVEGSHLSWPEAHGLRVEVSAPEGLVTGLSLFVAVADDTAATDTVAEIQRTVKKLPNTGRVRRRQGVVVIPVGSWQLELRPVSSPARVWVEVTETFTWSGLLEAAEDYLRRGFSREFALRHRLIGPEDSISVGRSQLWHGAEHVRADVDAQGLASLKVPVPRGWGGRGDKQVQQRALADDLDRLGDRWEGRRCYGWRVGDRWVLLSRSDFEADFSLEFTRQDALSVVLRDDMWLLADHAPGSDAKAGVGLLPPEVLIGLVRAIVASPRLTGRSCTPASWELGSSTVRRGTRSRRTGWPP